MLTSKLEAEMELVGRHLIVLKYVILHQPVGIIKLSQLLNMPEHKIRYSLRLLEQEGLVEASTAGARATPEVKKVLKHLQTVFREIEEKAAEMRKVVDEIENMEFTTS